MIMPNALRAPRWRAAPRVTLRCLGLSALIAFAGGCQQNNSPTRQSEYGILRTRLFQQCMASAANVTPANISDRGSWSEVVGQCGDQAYYQANTCDDPRACLAALPAIATEAGTAETPQSGSVHEGAAPEGIAHPSPSRNPLR